MWIIDLLIAILFLIFGLFLQKGKGAFLIAGYNTLPKKEKDKYDKDALCKFMSKVAFSMMVSFIILSVSNLFEKVILMWFGWILFGLTIIFTLIYGNTGNRFKNEK